MFDGSTGIWWLVYVENVGMFCFLCRCHDTTSPTNGDSTWNSKPCVHNITQAIKLHANSAMHAVAINKEHLQRTSPFPKEGQEREMVKNTVLLKGIHCTLLDSQRRDHKHKSNIVNYIVGKAWVTGDKTLSAQITRFYS